MNGRKKLKVAVIGLGYFSTFHLRAWQRIEEVELVGAADPDESKRAEASRLYSVPAYCDLGELLASADPDVIDLVTPPPTHADLVSKSLRKGRIIVCQKPFCTSLEEAATIATAAEQSGTELVIHENFRFQPWHRKIKSMLDNGSLGQVYSCRFALRPGDGRGADAYLSRQPSFQKMQRFLFHETGVHFLDVFKWLFGEVESIYAECRQLNRHIAGEDDGLFILSHKSGVRAIFDGNRLSDHAASDRRKTMGEMVIDAEAGTLRLDGNGRLFLREFGGNEETEVPYLYEDRDYSGNCVEALNRHIIEHKLRGSPLENRISEYLDIIRLDQSAYESVKAGCRIMLAHGENDRVQ